MPSIKLSEKEIKEFCERFKEYEVAPTNEFMEHFFKLKGASVSIFKSGKCVFQGSSLDIFSDYIDIKKSDIEYDDFDTIGMDEVGTGDLFGPIVTCALLVRCEDVFKLKEKGIKDSKTISDSTILKLGKYLISNFKFKTSIVRNEIYNDHYNEYNMNSMKAKLHNQNLKLLSKEVNFEYVCLDEFCSKDKYFEYLGEDAFKDIHFEMKGESKSIACAASSIVARYYLLLEFERLKKLYGYDLPKGSGDASNKMLQKIKDDNKEDILYHIAKLNFKNINK